MMKNTAFQLKLQCPVWSSVKDKKEGRMYGILLESVQFFVIKDVGEDIWHRVLEHAGMKNMVFSTHNTYSDELMVKLASSCCHVTKRTDLNQWMTFFGTCFVEFCSLYGYDDLLRVSGRYYRDFLHGIDNIHEIIRFSYPRLQSPSFLILFEDREGCVLLYQSKRRGFKYYVKGQLSQIAKMFYKVTVDITIIEEDIADNICSVKFRLDFDNSVYLSKDVPAKVSGNQSFTSITGDTFLKVFPFCVIFNNQLIIKNVGHSMTAFLKRDNLIGCHLREKFHIRRPLIPCIWNRILRFQRVIFELEYIQDDSDLSDLEEGDDPPLKASGVSGASQSDNQKCLLRGEMKYMADWDMVAFLCTPLLNNLKELQNAGLYINDLNMFDMSRDMVMAGWQHASQLERSIEQQQDKSEQISDNMTKIEEWKEKSDSLLYSMIPESIAERLKSGMNPIDTCQLFDLVTIMFVYMVGFADICTSSSPMEIVKCINNLFVVFDQIVDQYDVFKVETLGDAVYMVAGGVPDRNPKHADNVALVALKLQEKAKTVIYQIGKDNLNTRIGMHSGSVVGGVVGRRMPQYCLFGDTVNTASRMQTYSSPGMTHVSEPCHECLTESKFTTIKRGKVNVKGKGEMQTYWLVGEVGNEQTQTVLVDSIGDTAQTLVKSSSCDNALDLYAMHASTSFAQIELKTGYQRSSNSQTSSLPKSHLTLSVPCEMTPRRADNQSKGRTDFEPEIDDLGLVSPHHHRTSDIVVDLEKSDATCSQQTGSKWRESTYEHGSEAASFFLDTADYVDTDPPNSSEIDQSDIDAVGGVDYTALTPNCHFTDTQQNNYANIAGSPQTRFLESERCEIKPDLKDSFSMFCPFMSSVVSDENNEQAKSDDGIFPKSKSQDVNRQTIDRNEYDHCINDETKTVPNNNLDNDESITANEGRKTPERLIKTSSPSLASNIRVNIKLDKTEQVISSDKDIQLKNGPAEYDKSNGKHSHDGPSNVDTLANKPANSCLLPSNALQKQQGVHKDARQTADSMCLFRKGANRDCDKRDMVPKSLNYLNDVSKSKPTVNKNNCGVDKGAQNRRKLCWIPAANKDQFEMQNTNKAENEEKQSPTDVNGKQNHSENILSETCVVPSGVKFTNCPIVQGQTAVCNGLSVEKDRNSHLHNGLANGSEK